MKVALVFDGLGLGGIERVGLNYSKLFLKLGYEVDIYNLKPKKNELETLFDSKCRIKHKKMQNYLVPEYYMLMVKRWALGKYLYPIVFLGVSFLSFCYRLSMGKRMKYDIAISFAGHFNDLSFVSRNYIKGDKKLCWLHGALSEYLVSSCTYGDLYRKIKNLCVLSKANEVATIAANRYLEKLNIIQIYNPLMDEECNMNYDKVNSLIEKYGHFMLMVGRFGKDKDQKTVIEAIRILRDKYGRSEAMVFVGDGETLNSCKKLVKDLNLENQVFFEGAQFDVQNYYKASSLFVHSSPAEGLPTVLLEAMRYEVPIIATDSLPGVTEILKNNKYGVKCEVANPEDMAEKINEMLSTDTLREHYIQMGKERLCDFSEERICSKLQEIVKNLQ